MRAAYASSIQPDAPLSGLTVGDLPFSAPEGWVPVQVRASVQPIPADAATVSRRAPRPLA